MADYLGINGASGLTLNASQESIVGFPFRLKDGGIYTGTDDISETGPPFATLNGGGLEFAAPENPVEGWSTSTLPSSEAWCAIAFGSNRFIVVSQGSSTGTGSNAGAYSDDNGRTWTAFTMPSVSRWTQAAYGGGRFAVVSKDGIVAVSSTGISGWTAYSLPVVSADEPFCIVHGSTEFAIGCSAANTGSSSNSIFISSGAYNIWTRYTLPVSGIIQNLAYSSGFNRFIGAMHSPSGGNENGTNIAIYGYYDVIGTRDWVFQSSSMPATARWQAFASPSITRTYAIAFNGGNVASTTSGGESWTSATSLTSSQWTCLATGNSNLIAVSQNSANCAISDFVSSGSLSWTYENMGGIGNVQNIAFGNNYFIGARYGGNIVFRRYTLAG